MRSPSVSIPLACLCILLAVVLIPASSSAGAQPGDSSLITSQPDAEPAASAPCTTWNLAADWRLFPNQENPSRDSCGNLGVWHYMMTDSSRSTYSLLPYFSTRREGVEGLQEWYGPPEYAWYNGLPEISFNATGADWTHPGGFTWLANTIGAHPGTSQPLVVGWQSPVDAVVSIKGRVTDFDGTCGDGVLWYFDKGSTNLAYGTVPNGGSEQLYAGTGGSSLDSVSVQTGEMLYLAIDPRWYEACDSTRPDLTIHLQAAKRLSGRITAAGGAPLGNVVVTVDGRPATRTDYDGNYVFYVLDGTHNITPSAACLAFSPPERVVTTPDEADGQDFVGTSTCTSTGHVSDSLGRPIPGVTISAGSGLTAVTDVGGNYVLPLTAGTHTLTASKTRYGFTPGQRSVTVPPAAVGQDFVGGSSVAYVPIAYNRYTPPFRDDFSNPNTGWDTADDSIAWYGYWDGEYRMLLRQQGWIVLAGPNQLANNLQVEVDARAASHTSGSYGLHFALSDAGFYYFDMHPGLGQFRLLRYDESIGRFFVLIPATYSPALKTGGAVNRLRVVHDGIKIELSANGTVLGYAYDSSYGEGYVGVSTASAADNFDARFDNFLLVFDGNSPTATPARSSGLKAGGAHFREDQTPAAGAEFR